MGPRVVCAVVVLLAVLSSCGGETAEPIASGRMGLPVESESCEWELRPGNVLRGQLQLIVRDPDGSERGSLVSPAEADDVTWIRRLTPCVDAPTYVFGGVDNTVGSVVLTGDAGDEVVLDAIEVPDEEFGAVIGPIPNEWRSLDSFEITAITRDGTVAGTGSCGGGGCAIARPG